MDLLGVGVCRWRLGGVLNKRLFSRNSVSPHKKSEQRAVFPYSVWSLPLKHMSVCYDSQAALKAVQAAITTSPLVQQCQRR